MRQTGIIFAGVISSFLLTQIDVMGADSADLRRAAGCENTVEYDIIELTGLEPFTFRAFGLNNAGQVVGGIFSDTLFRWDDPLPFVYQLLVAARLLLRSLVRRAPVRDLINEGIAWDRVPARVADPQPVPVQRAT